jgi:hypothetical protein
MRGTLHSSRPSAGNPGLEDISVRGLPRNQAYVLEGSLRTEVTLAVQFILEGDGQDESNLSVHLSESNSLA